MPTYDYECEECGYHFEKFHGMSEEPVSRCPKCGGPVRRLKSGGSGIIFKGQGFYATDYSTNSGGLRCWTMPLAKNKGK